MRQVFKFSAAYDAIDLPKSLPASDAHEQRIVRRVELVSVDGRDGRFGRSLIAGDKRGKELLPCFEQRGNSYHYVLRSGLRQGTHATELFDDSVETGRS